MNHIDPDLLTTFLAFADGGSLARAASIVGRSPSAVTAQMQRLEEVVGEALMVPAGRGRTLTSTGEVLVGHARRILDAHRAALLDLKGRHSAGDIAIGATQDFADHGLPDLLRRFATAHPRLRVTLRIGRSGELADALAHGALDVAITLRSGPTADEVATLNEPMIWLAAAGGLVSARDVVPLALLDPPCGFRAAALAALDRAGRDYRIAAESQSLAGLRTAVLAGLAVTARTPRWATSVIVPATGLDLPMLGDTLFAIRLRPDANTPAEDLAQLLAEGLRAGGDQPRWVG